MTKMKNKNIHIGGARGIALFLIVILAGFFCLSAWAPDVDAGKGKTDNSANVTSAAGGEDAPGVQEQEQTPAKIARKHFPWLWVAAGVVVIGVVLYFTVFKKPEYKLNVSLGTGVSGTPVAGTFIYKKGKKIHYLYSPGYGYRDLKVTLDNKAVAVSGEITMDGDHTLSVTAEEQFYALTVTLGTGVTGTPGAGSYSYKVGTSITYSYAEAAGYNNLKVQIDGGDAPASGTIVMDRSHALEATAEAAHAPSDPFDENGEWWLVETILPKNGGGTKTYLVTFTRLRHNHGDGHVTMAQPSGENHSYNYDRNSSPTGAITLIWLVYGTEWYQRTYRGTFSGPDYVTGAVYEWHYPGNNLIQDNTWTMTRASD